jgi:hypothetical protein
VSRDGVLSILSLILGVALTVVVGAFSGFSTNPDRTAAFNSAHRELARIGATGTLEELQQQVYKLAQKYPGFGSPEPHPAIAIIKTYPLLLGTFSLGCLCLLRPKNKWIAAIFTPAAIVGYLIIGLDAALSLAGAALLAPILSATYVRIKRKIAP